ncbi:MAG: hypothetical protein KAR22_10605 [Gammaproteobacteria bacterium]|nr:hypothetical protein [Gammaproteobacteria bacterium]
MTEAWMVSNVVVLALVAGVFWVARFVARNANVLRVRRQVHVYWVHALLVVGFFLAQAQVLVGELGPNASV